MSRVVLVVLALALTLLALTPPSHQLPPPQSDEDVPERVREFMLLRRLIDNLSQAQDPPAPPAVRVAHELQLLARALEADLDFHDLNVSKRAIQTFCKKSGGSRQCRSFCFNLGDPACADGDVGGNGEDAKFLATGFHPGK